MLNCSRTVVKSFAAVVKCSMAVVSDVETVVKCVASVVIDLKAVVTHLLLAKALKRLSSRDN